MEEYIKKYGRNSLISSVLLSLLAICLICIPVVSFKTLVICFGMIIAIAGVIHIVSYFISPIESRMFNFELLEGICGITLGLIISLNPGWLGIFLPIMIAIWVIGSSIVRIQISLNMRALPGNNWILIFILAIFTLFIGFACFWNPFISSYQAIVLTGILLLICEIFNIIEYSCILVKLGKQKNRNRKKKVATKTKEEK